MSIHDPDPYARPSERMATSDFFTRADIARFFRANSKFIAAPVALGLFVASIYLMMASPIYTARSELLIDPKLPQAIRETGDSNAIFDAPQLESQIAVLRSESVAREVVSKLNLQDNPDFSGQPTASFISRFLALSPPSLLPEGVRKSNAIDAVRSGLDLRRIGASYAIEVTFPSKDPRVAADVVNATSAAYLEDLINARGESARQGGVWLEQRVEELRNQMNEAARRVQEFRASHDYRIHRKTDGPLGGEPVASNNAGDASATLEELESTAATYRKIYENFYQAFTEAVQRESYPISNARVISPAKPPLVKSHPKSMLILMLAGLVGGLSGVAIALLRSSIDTPVTDARTVRSQLGLSCLGQIPTVGFPGRSEWQIRLRKAWEALSKYSDDNGASTSMRLKSAWIALSNPSGSAAHRSLLWHSVDVPMASFSHAIRRVKTGISLEAKAKPIQVLGVSSLSPGEGKTTLAANLASQFATKSARVLLIDADVYRATLTANVATEATTGLIEVLLKTADLDTAVISSPYDGLSILPMVRKPETTIKAQTLLSSEEIAILLKNARQEFDTIVIDLPPLKISAESYELAAKLDALLLVAEAEVTPLSSLDEAVTSLRQARVRVAGLVINKLSPSLFRSSRQHSDYYHQGA